VEQHEMAARSASIRFSQSVLLEWPRVDFTVGAGHHN
jgi:hypothetical protein